MINSTATPDEAKTSGNTTTVGTDREHIGHHLRNLREKKGLSIETIAEATKVSPSKIRAIEAHDYEHLPAEIFTRGLVTIYADFLGVNGKEIAELFIQAHNRTAPQHTPKQKLSQQIPTPKRFAEPSHFPPAAVAGIILLLITTLLGFFYHYTAWNPFRTSSTVVEQPHPAGNSRVRNTVALPADENEEKPGIETAPAAKEMTTAPPEVQSPEQPPQSTVQSAQPPMQPDQSAAPQADQALPPQQPSTSQVEAPPAANDGQPSVTTEQQPIKLPPPPYTLTILFLKDTWVDESRDNQESTRYSFKKGEKRVVRAEKALNLIFEQAQSATLQLNGQNIPFPSAGNGNPVLVIPAQSPQP